MAAAMPRARAPRLAGAERWRMGAEARALVTLMACCSPSASPCCTAPAPSSRCSGDQQQLVLRRPPADRRGCRIVVFAIAAKMDAERGATGRGRSCGSRSSLLLLLCCRSPRASRRASTARGGSSSAARSSRRARQARRGGLDVDAHREEGRAAAPPDQGCAAVLRGHRHARHAGGAGAGSLGGDAVHADARACCCSPAACASRTSSRSARSRSRSSGTRSRRSNTRCCALTSFLDPGSAPAQVNYQLKQSLIAMASNSVAPSRWLNALSASASVVGTTKAWAVPWKV